MKTKSKLVLGLSILSAATLAAGATSTFAWYVSGNTVNTSGSAGLQLTQQEVAAGTSSAVVTISEVTSGDAGKLALTDGAGNSYYYVTGDLTNEHPLAHDATHMASVKLKIHVAPATGFIAADGNYVINITLASPGRLGAEVTGSSYDAYVATAQATNVYVGVTVASGTFDAFDKYCYVSITGQDGVDETATEILANKWTFVWADSAETGYSAAANS